MCVYIYSIVYFTVLHSYFINRATSSDLQTHSVTIQSCKKTEFKVHVNICSMWSDIKVFPRNGRDQKHIKYSSGRHQQDSTLTQKLLCFCLMVIQFLAFVHIKLAILHGNSMIVVFIQLDLNRISCPLYLCL